MQIGFANLIKVAGERIPYSKLNFFKVHCVYLFKNCPQFLSHWKPAEPVFCSKELNSLAKTKTTV